MTPGFGPAVEAAAHVVLVPLVRVGLYLQYDASPISGQDTRDVFSAGLDVRVLSPWPRGDLRGYARAGVGEVGTYASAHVSTGDRGFTGFRFVPGADGSFTEAPVAIGVLYRVAPPVWFAAEVGARVGFAFAGGAYSPTSSSHGGTCPTSGDDTLAVFADLGVMWGR